MSHTDHPRIPGTHRALPSRDDKDLYGDMWAPRRIKAIRPERVTITEAVTERLVGEPRRCWDLGAEYDHECTQVSLNLLNADILTELARAYPWEREEWEQRGHVSHLTLVDSGWGEPLDPDYWDAEDDEDEDLDDPEDLEDWERDLMTWEIVGVSA